MVGQCLIYYKTEMSHDFFFFFWWTIKILNWSHTPESKSWMVDKTFLLGSPDLNNFGLWFNEYDQFFELW